ncbi:MAG: stage III sporulation protein AF [Bacillota bacterium]|jgi:stage III sporulation protein AF|nr:stage III sporulation protein AF [Bacillota bacterium]NLJ03490.1 stage III sporulation protein AF [Bacillota bacterium]
MYWKQWLQTLLTLAVLLGILEMLLPSGELAKYSKLVLGLALMLAVLEPVSILLNQDLTSFEISWQGSSTPEPNVNALASRVKLAAAAPFVSLDENSLEGQIEDALLGLDYVEAVRVEISDAGKNGALIHVFLQPFEAESAEQVGQIVASLLHFPSEQISVQRWAE